MVISGQIYDISEVFPEHSLLQTHTLWETTIRHSNIRRCPSIHNNQHGNRFISQFLITKFRERRYRLRLTWVMGGHLNNMMSGQNSAKFLQIRWKYPILTFPVNYSSHQRHLRSQPQGPVRGMNWDWKQRRGHRVDNSLQS